MNPLEILLLTLTEPPSSAPAPSEPPTRRSRVCWVLPMACALLRPQLFLNSRAIRERCHWLVYQQAADLVLHQLVETGYLLLRGWWRVAA